MLKFLVFLVFALQTAAASMVNFDKMTHDFGKVTVKDGPLSCSFVITNTGSGPMNIKTVVSSCGCTKVTWTRKDIAPGQSGEIVATYSNDEGPNVFDKTLTVYVTTQKKPVVLHMRGIVKKN